MYKKDQKLFRDRLNIWLFLLLIIFIFIYFIFKIFDYISGPIIKIYSPLPYETINEDTFILKGNVKNAKNIYINGREIKIDQNGNFEEDMIAKSPYTLISIDAIDKYGKKREKNIEIGKE